jgi:AraC family ethanolamine operon transcriptional activator
MFVDGVAAVRSFDHFDEMAASVPALEVEYTRLGSGTLSARVEVAMTAQLQISHVTINTAFLVTGCTPRGASGSSLIISGPPSVRSRARTIDPATTAPGRLQAGEFHFVSEGPTDMVRVLVDQALFDRHVQGRFNREVWTLGADWLLRPLNGSANCGERGRAIVHLLSVLTSRAAASQEARHRLEECVLHILLDDIETDVGASPGVPSWQRRRVARAAEELLRARMDDPPSLRELCELLRVPERTVHHAFQEAFGLRPRAYLRSLRLNAAHRRLRAGVGPVTDVATDLGMFHFGRFATEYRAMFGESPSETLRAARGLRKSREAA